MVGLLAPADAAERWPKTTFVDGAETAIATAREIAGDQDVTEYAANVIQQALDLGLVDEVLMSLVPTVVERRRANSGASAQPRSASRGPNRQTNHEGTLDVQQEAAASAGPHDLPAPAPLAGALDAVSRVGVVILLVLAVFNGAFLYGLPTLTGADTHG